MSVCFTYLYILSTVSVLGGVTSNQSRESADEIEQSLAKRYVKVLGKKTKPRKPKTMAFVFTTGEIVDTIKINDSLNKFTVTIQSELPRPIPWNSVESEL